MDVHALGREDFVSITTFRRDGTPVATPMWVVESDGLLYLWTGSQTGKVKRIRNNPEVTLAPCTRGGRVTGVAVPATARILPMGERPQLWPAFPAKYGWTLRLIIIAERISEVLRIGPFHKQGERIYIELTVANRAPER